MYKNNIRQGFTLIELLVVVLIIGILAAVALPQYQVAVEKSRAMEGLVKLKALSAAIDQYYLATNTQLNNTSDLEKLDVSARNTSLWTVDYNPSGYLVLQRKEGNNVLYQLSYLPPYNISFPRRKACNIEKKTDDNSIGSKMCKSLCGTSTLTPIWGSGQVGCVLK